MFVLHKDQVTYFVIFMFFLSVTGIRWYVSNIEILVFSRNRLVFFLNNKTTPPETNVSSCATQSSVGALWGGSVALVSLDQVFRGQHGNDSAGIDISFTTLTFEKANSSRWKYVILSMGRSALTVLTVSSGGLSLMSVMLISAVAVLDKPKFKLPSMSVAWMMMVYWDTFCRKKNRGDILREWYLKCFNKPGSDAWHFLPCDKDTVSHNE